MSAQPQERALRYLLRSSQALSRARSIFLRRVRLCVLLLVAVPAAWYGNLGSSGAGAEHAPEHPWPIAAAWVDGSRTDDARGNGPDDDGVAPAITGVMAQEGDLRTGPGTSYNPIIHLGQGDPLRIQLRYEDWFKVAAVDGTEGWLNTTLITFTQGAAQDVPLASYVPPTPPAADPPPADAPPADAAVAETPPAEEQPPADEQPAAGP